MNRTEFEMDQAMQSHQSAEGVTHLGSREFCVSVDCTPPSLPVREGDEVRIDIPDRGESGILRVMSRRGEDGIVTLILRDV